MCRIKPANKWSAPTTQRPRIKCDDGFSAELPIRYIPIAIPLTASQRDIYGIWMSYVGSDDHISMRPKHKQQNILH